MGPGPSPDDGEPEAMTPRRGVCILSRALNQAPAFAWIPTKNPPPYESPPGRPGCWAA